MNINNASTTQLTDLTIRFPKTYEKYAVKSGKSRKTKINRYSPIHTYYEILKQIPKKHKDTKTP